MLDVVVVVVAAAAPVPYCIVVKIRVHGILYEEHATKDVRFCLACVAGRLSVHRSDEASC